MATTHTQVHTAALVTVTVAIDLSAVDVAKRPGAAVEAMAIAEPQAAKLIDSLPYVGIDSTRVVAGVIS
jgi:hypothetical protein